VSIGYGVRKVGASCRLTSFAQRGGRDIVLTGRDAGISPTFRLLPLRTFSAMFYANCMNVRRKV
jgi:hypothetical protein